MKKILILLTAILLLAACKKNPFTPEPVMVMGKNSEVMLYTSTPVITGNQLSFTMALTIGARYSFQLSDINGKVVITRGIEARSNTEHIIMDISNVEKGLYDLSVVDTKGNELKNPLIIK
jgi:hypothetical protein